MARWEEVLDTQLSVHNWLTSKHGRTFAAGYFESVVTSRTTDVIGDITDPEEARRKGSAWAELMGVAAFNAEPIYVDPDMMTVCEGAVRGFAPEPLAFTDLITPMGFLVLPRSMWLTDPQGKHLSWRVALWLPSLSKGDKMPANGEGSGIHLVLFHDVKEPDDIDDGVGGFANFLKENGQRWTTDLIPTHVVTWPYGKMHPGDGDGTFNGGTAWDIDISKADDPSQPVFVDPETGEPFRSIVAPSSRGETAHKQLQGLWRLLSQYLAVPSKQRPPRQAARRARAANLPHEHVTIVRLRRPPQDKHDHEPSTVDWQQRWVVGGHWRRQWYSSLGVHRQIWISPFIKGPEDKPLIVNKARIFELVR